MSLTATLRSLFGSQYFWFTAMILPVGGAAGYWLRTREEVTRQADVAKIPLTQEDEERLAEQLMLQRQARRKQLLANRERVQAQIQQLEAKMHGETKD
ncbi:hypothetical protein BJ684DRAFT_19782 [Piptocephalis cylindrospora]|uniref:Uncharacterized protein n=1 Tax=Piptocephalis cylindrospora TaxID=1907219 RepID=A0A4P9Y495_9FUNG|nr:hypothetical protein BJ684DRAFT_19782 [Piptocephalis cylindrospora]|eukprot:RKP13757.1 hypothetical protein BJ684DRAFT_19782 [Piptocephalis cylindrospora]